MSRRNSLTLIVGTLFGFMLCWLSFIQYDTIFDALSLRDWYLWKVFVTAVVVGGIGLWVLRISGARTWLTRERIEWEQVTVSRGNLIGGATFGLGWAIAGTCPGPALAQVGSGHLSGLFTAAGIFAGIAICDRLRPES